MALKYGEWEITTLLKEFCKILLYVKKNNRRVPLVLWYTENLADFL
jgi:hypothetical protein